MPAQAFTLPNIISTGTYLIPLGLVADASGAVAPVPTGDVFTAAVTGPGAASIAAVPAPLPAGAALPDGGTSVGGEPGLLINAVALPDANTMGMVVTVSDSDGDVACTITVNYPVPPVVEDVVADIANTLVGTQPAPTAPGP